MKKLIIIGSICGFVGYKIGTVVMGKAVLKLVSSAEFKKGLKDRLDSELSGYDFKIKRA